MADMFAVAGAKIYMGAAMAAPSADLALTDYSAVTWTEIKKWMQCGSFGDTAALITSQIISESRDVKQKGTKNAGAMQNNFGINTADAGQIALIAAAQSDNNYPFKVLWDDAPIVRTSTATMTIASPGVVTWTAHGLAVGDQVSFSTTGALPTGLAAATTYFVKTVLSADTFTLAATTGGTVIATTGTQSGVHTISTVPLGSQSYFVGLVMTAKDTGGGANTVRQLESQIEINSNVLAIAAIQ
jgi:hypothetical protein